jgi:hypothetical protein
MNNTNLRAIVRGAHDIQKLRIQTGNRIVANFKTKLGQAPGEDEDTLNAEGKMILNNIRIQYKKITDGVKDFPKQSKFVGDEIISDYTELCLIAQYEDIYNHEEEHFKKRLKNLLQEYPVYTEFLENVKGIGPAMAGVIISEIDIHKAKYPSSIWAYAGLDVGQDGKGRSRKKEHLVESTYTDSDGETQTKMGISFNPWLKTKLVGVLCSSFLRAGENKYSKIYYDYKNRLDNSPAHAEKTKKHRHNMAIRYMVKLFLVDLYVAWRTIEGLEVHKPYHEAKLGIVHTV